jgi:hypothetical protein
LRAICAKSVVTVVPMLRDSTAGFTIQIGFDPEARHASMLDPSRSAKLSSRSYLISRANEF